MIIFFTAILILVIAYFTYGKFVENVWGIDKNKITPAIKYADGIDYVKMPVWKVFLIQFLNIAGLGPVFGAILGAVYGPVCIVWRVLGSIFAGGVHDFLCGMISVKFKGKSIVYITEKLFGNNFKIVFLIFYLLLLILLGTVFAINPVKMLADMSNMPVLFWGIIVFGYYFLTTVMPIDKIIGKCYPYFALLLLVMTVSIMVKLIFSGAAFYPELTLANLHPNKTNIFPILFIVVACGAISGFHATQSPLMARCLPNEKDGRKIFYGTMLTESVIAIIWATLGISFYQQTGGLLNVIEHHGQGAVISEISKGMLGQIGGMLTVLSIIVLSITSGDTAFRSARITIADFMRINQKNVVNRFIISLIIITISILLSRTNWAVLWQYFGCANQALSSLVLWTLTYYLAKKNKFYIITLVPAMFMTAVVVSYISQVDIGFSLSATTSNIIGVVVSILLLLLFLFVKYNEYNKKNLNRG